MMYAYTRTYCYVEKEECMSLITTIDWDTRVELEDIEHLLRGIAAGLLSPDDETFNKEDYFEAWAERLKGAAARLHDRVAASQR